MPVRGHKPGRGPYHRIRFNCPRLYRYSVGPHSSVKGAIRLRGVLPIRQWPAENFLAVNRQRRAWAGVTGHGHVCAFALSTLQQTRGLAGR